MWGFCGLTDFGFQNKQGDGKGQEKIENRIQSMAFSRDFPRDLVSAAARPEQLIALDDAKYGRY